MVKGLCLMMVEAAMHGALNFVIFGSLKVYYIMWIDVFVKTVVKQHEKILTQVWKAYILPHILPDI